MFMRNFAVLAASLCAFVFATLSPAADEASIAPVPRTPSLVKSVTVEGGTAKIKLATRVGEQVDPGHLRKDVQALWSTGQFEDIRVQTTEDIDGTAVVFEVFGKPTLFLRDLRMEPNNFGMQPTLTTGTPIDPFRAQQVAGQIRRKLIERGYQDATVEPELKPIGKNKADLLIHVTAGDSIKVDEVELTGNTVFGPKEVQNALQALRIRRIVPAIPGIWHGYVMHPAYSEEAVQSDLARLQSFYLARGYFDARISLDNAVVEGENAKLRLFVNPGPHYQVKQMEISGTGIETNIMAPRNGLFVSRDLCSCLMRYRRDAEKKGIVDFNARLNFHTLESEPGHDPIADLTAQVDQGKPYTINRIEFQGPKHYKEATIRKNMLLDEGDILDQTMLRKSLARLNQTQMFDPVEETQVAVNTDEATGTANILIPLHERKRGTWNFSGPVGPISFAGPLQFMLASRLPPWGQGILELSTYYISFSAIGFAQPLAKIIPLTLARQGILPVFSIFRPYTPGEGWKSGFLIAPQLGWQTALYTYATTQITSRLVPIIAGNDRYISQLAVTFERPAGDGVLLCDPPKPRFHLARASAAMALQFLASSPMF